MGSSGALQGLPQLQKLQASRRATSNSGNRTGLSHRPSTVLPSAGISACVSIRKTSRSLLNISTSHFPSAFAYPLLSPLHPPRATFSLRQLWPVGKERLRCMLVSATYTSRGLNVALIGSLSVAGNANADRTSVLKIQQYLVLKFLVQATYFT